MLYPALFSYLKNMFVCIEMYDDVLFKKLYKRDNEVSLLAWKVHWERIVQSNIKKKNENEKSLTNLFLTLAA